MDLDHWVEQGELDGLDMLAQVSQADALAQIRALIRGESCALTTRFLQLTGNATDVADLREAYTFGAFAAVRFSVPKGDS